MSWPVASTAPWQIAVTLAIVAAAAIYLVRRGRAAARKLTKGTGSSAPKSGGTTPLSPLRRLDRAEERKRNGES